MNIYIYIYDHYWLQRTLHTYTCMYIYIYIIYICYIILYYIISYYIILCYVIVYYTILYYILWFWCSNSNFWRNSGEVPVKFRRVLMKLRWTSVKFRWSSGEILAERVEHNRKPRTKNITRPHRSAPGVFLQGSSAGRPPWSAHNGYYYYYHYYYYYYK